MRLDTEAQHIWFTADLHLLHPKICAICERPTTIEEHDEWIIDRINSVVGKKDQLYILGDVSMGDKMKTEKLLDKIHGNKSLILGNHDNNIAHSTRFGEITQLKDFNFNSESFPNIHLVLFHYPIASWNRRIHGSAHLYGHCHGRFQNAGLSFDVGLDANDYFPLNLVEVCDKMTKISLNLF